MCVIFLAFVLAQNQVTRIFSKNVLGIDKKNEIKVQQSVAAGLVSGLYALEYV